MHTLYQMHQSGNCYKVRLVAHHVGVALDLHDIDVMGGGTRTPEFLKINPNGRVPALALDDGRVLAESNAILWYLAEGTPLLPLDKWGRAQALQWMFFEQYSHEPYIAVARFWLAFASKEKLEAKKALIPEWHAQGDAALGVMDRHLSAHKWFAGEHFSIADFALFAYTHCAGEGGFDLDKFPGVRGWLARVVALPKHISMQQRIES
jgi:glutathione S-transferase